jgi:hypothetical protein
MKNLYNTIEQNLKAGLNVVVRDLKDNTYCTISNSKDYDGSFRDSGWWKSIEKAKQYIGSYYGDSKEYWDDYDLEIIEVFRPEYEPFKVGDKVRILDSIKKIDNWGIIGKDFPDMTGEIEGVHLGISGTYYLVNGFYIGHEYLAPLVEQEEDVALEAIKLLEEKGYKIIKK